MKSMIRKFGQDLLWQGRGPSGCANARSNSRCSSVSDFADSRSTRRQPQVIMALARGSARSRQRLSPRISLNLKVSLKCSCRMLFHSAKVRLLVWLGKTKRPFQAIHWKLLIGNPLDLVSFSRLDRFNYMRLKPKALDANFAHCGCLRTCAQPDWMSSNCINCIDNFSDINDTEHATGQLSSRLFWVNLTRFDSGKSNCNGFCWCVHLSLWAKEERWKLNKKATPHMGGVAYHPFP